jgi:hypothetical protein
LCVIFPEDRQKQNQELSIPLIKSTVSYVVFFFFFGILKVKTSNVDLKQLGVFDCFVGMYVLYDNDNDNDGAFPLFALVEGIILEKWTNSKKTYQYCRHPKFAQVSDLLYFNIIYIIHSYYSTLLCSFCFEEFTMEIIIIIVWFLLH